LAIFNRVGGPRQNFIVSTRSAAAEFNRVGLDRNLAKSTLAQIWAYSDELALDEIWPFWPSRLRPKFGRIQPSMPRPKFGKIQLSWSRPKFCRVDPSPNLVVLSRVNPKWNFAIFSWAKPNWNFFESILPQMWPYSATSSLTKIRSYAAKFYRIGPNRNLDIFGWVDPNRNSFEFGQVDPNQNSAEFDQSFSKFDCVGAKDIGFRKFNINFFYKK